MRYELLEILEVFFQKPAINKSGFLKECNWTIQAYNRAKSKNNIPERYIGVLSEKLKEYGYNQLKS